MKQDTELHDLLYDHQCCIELSCVVSSHSVDAPQANKETLPNLSMQAWAIHLPSWYSPRTKAINATIVRRSTLPSIVYMFHDEFAICSKVLRCIGDTRSQLGQTSARMYFVEADKGEWAGRIGYACMISGQEDLHFL